MLDGAFLYRRLVHLMSSACWFVRHCHDADNVVTVIYNSLKAFHGKLWSAEKHNAEIFLCHFAAVVLSGKINKTRSLLQLLRFMLNLKSCFCLLPTIIAKAVLPKTGYQLL